MIFVDLESRYLCYDYNSKYGIGLQEIIIDLLMASVLCNAYFGKANVKNYFANGESNLLIKVYFNPKGNKNY